MAVVRLALLTALALVVAPLAAQRPKTAAEALQHFEKVHDRSEAERRRAVGDLGDFEGPEITAVLLAEAARAEDLGYRQTVVRALGNRARNGAVPALQKLLREATNNRLMDSAAEGLARQGEEGVKALGAVLAEERSGGARRSSVCDGLGRAEGDAARDLLLGECKSANGRDRLPALRALSRRADDAAVDALRIQLAGDKDTLVAATALRQLADHGSTQAPGLAVQLLRRLGTEASPEHYTAVLRGVLLDPVQATAEVVLAAACRAEDPFGKDQQPAWTKALADATFQHWLVSQAGTRKTPHERAIAALALAYVAEADRPAAAATLVKMLGQKDPEVIGAAADALVAFGRDLAVPPLEKLLAGGTEPMLPIAMHALHALRGGDPSWLDELLHQAAGKTPNGRAAALRLLAGLPHADPARALAAAGDNLAHKAWQVRAAAIELIVALRAPAGIPLLIERTGQEQARLQQDVENALFELTRLRFPDVATWRAWWQKEGATFEVPKSAKEKDGKGRDKHNGGASTAATYWDIPLRSDRVVFVVDVSGSMNQPFATGGGTRLDEAKRQLIRVLGVLPPKAKANVITFGNGTDAFAESLQSFDAKRRNAAEQWTQGLVSKGATNVFAAMQRAFADAEIDTIFLLTDGQPSTGEIVEPGPLAEKIAAWNLGRGVRIHTIAIGGKSDFLERLARESGGEHTVAK